MPFLFEKLVVYQKSLEFLKNTQKLSNRLKGRLTYSLIDQMIRASSSIPLNIAEGNGRWHKKEKQQFFRIARGSVFEIVPILQTIYSMEYIKMVEYQYLYNELEVLSKLLFNLIKSTEKQNNSLELASKTRKN